MIILASASPRRRELLKQIGLSFEVQVSDAPEISSGLPPAEVAVENARQKAMAVGRLKSNMPVLGADTIVVLADQIFGKPTDESDANDMLTKLSGKCHQVITGLAVAYDGQVFTSSVTTEVYVATLTAEEITAFVATGEWEGKAGAYAIQGRAAAFISHINGSYSNVVGLPLYQTLSLLKKNVPYDYLQTTAGRV